jgi:hypothetical protein
MQKRPLFLLIVLLGIILAAIWAYDQRFPDRIPLWLSVFVTVAVGSFLVFAALAELTGKNLSDFFRSTPAEQLKEDQNNHGPKPSRGQLVSSLVAAASQMMSDQKPVDAIQARFLAGRMALIGGASQDAYILFEQAQKEAIQKGLADIERRCSLELAELQMAAENYRTATDLAVRGLRGPKISPQRIRALSLHAEALWKNRRASAALESYARAAKGFEACATAERQRKDVLRHELVQAKSYYLLAWDAWRAVMDIASYRRRQLVEGDAPKIERTRERLHQIESDALMRYERIGKLIGAIEYEIGEVDRIEKEMAGLIR